MIEKVNVLGREYKIQYEDLDPEGIWGEHVQDDGVIRIHHALPPDVRRATIVHEVMHAILFESGLNKTVTRKLEEAICRAVEHGLSRSGLIRDDF